MLKIFITQDKKLSIYLMITQDLDLKLFMKQKKNEAKQDETKQDETKKDETKQDGTGLKVLTCKQILRELPIALAQVKAYNNSERLLNEIRQIVYYLYQSKEKITKNVYNSMIKSIQI